MKFVMKIFFVGLFALVKSNSYSQTVYLTIPTGSFDSEKWMNITTGINGTGTQVWGQGNGTYGNGSGTLTNKAIDLSLYCGTTLFLNAYDQYADGWDGSKYKLMLTPNGTIIINNSNNSPSGNGDTDASSAWNNPPPSIIELETSESFSVACICTAPTSVALSNFTTPICSGDSPGTFTADAVGGSPTSYTYLWYKDAVSTGVTTQTYAPGNLTANTNVYCAVSSGTGCTTNSATQTITVNTVPTGVTAVASPNPVCPGTTLTLTGSATNATSWSWTGPNTFTSTSQSPTVASFAAVNEGVYELVATNTCGSALSVNTGSVTVSTTVPSGVAASATPNPICIGGSLTLTGSAAGGTSWSWSGPNGFSSTSQNPTISGVTAAAAGVYTLVATNCVGSSAGVNTASVVIVSGVPTAVSATATPNPVLENTALSLTGAATGAVSWSWTGPNGYTSSSQSPTISSTPTTGAGVYTLVASNACGSAAAANTASVVVTPDIQIWYVNDGSLTGDIWCTAVGNNTNTGKTSNSPYRSLSHLLRNKGVSGTNELAYGDIIRIDAGTYNDLLGTNPDWDHQMIVNIAGLNFVGAGIGITIYDHQYAGSNTDFFMCITANDVTVQNMTITGYENQGTQAGQCQARSGQAISIGGATGVVFTNVMVNQNGQSGGNAAIAINANSTVTLNGGGSFCNMYGTSYTGGIDVYGNNINLTINNYIIGYNYKPLFDGGGIRIEGGSNTNVSINNSRICNNVALMGGGIAMYNGNLTMTNCVIADNSAIISTYDNIGSVYDPTYGGAFFISAGTATFTGCTFSGNNGGNNHPSVPGGGTNGTYLRGGAIAARYNGTTGSFSANKISNVTIDNCSFTNNQSNATGIDIYGAVASSNACNIAVTRSQFNTALNFNILAANTPNISINTSGTAVTQSGANYTSAASTYNANPTPPNYLGTCGSIAVLPIELIDFTALCEKTHAKLEWSTAAEHNNDFFTIERAGSNAVFDVITQIDGAMNSTEKTDYIFADYYAEEGMNYYRLSQTDVNGTTRELKTISLNNNCLTGSGLDISSSYNSTNNSINLGYKFDHNEVLEASVYNAMGQIVQISEIFLKSSDRFAEINLMNSFSNGIYFLKLSNSSIVFSDKIMVSK